jgi:hypothetical protein
VAEYIPDPSGSLTFEWVARQFYRISSVISAESSGNRIIRVTKIDDGDSPYTTRDRDSVILADATSGTITINLQAGINERVLYIKNIASSGANAVTVTPDGSDDYDYTGGDITLTPIDSVQIIYSDAEANWFSI